MEGEKTNNNNTKLNDLNTKVLPPLLMLIAGIISFVICLIFSYELKSMLLVMFISMLVFAIIGTVIKSIVDRFNMRMDYDDLFDDDEDMK
ncbi:MAG TPA: hypothetical protein DCP07_06405 [Lachnospiraceae bacterium]|nr:hypothetical protein [Lachnospiraceae bacterium]